MIQQIIQLKQKILQLKNEIDLKISILIIWEIILH